MNIAVTTVTPIFPQSVFVQWAYIPDVGVQGNFTFKVERSGSPEGPWVTLSANLVNQISFTDDLTANNPDDVNLASLVRSVFYRVTVTAPNLRTATSAAVSLDGERELDNKQINSNDNPFATIKKRKHLLRRKILRDEQLQLRVFNGIEAKILKRRHFGQRCTSCFDPMTKMTTKGQCTVCYGTSWVGGYFNPINALIRFAASPVQSSLANDGKNDINSNQITLLNYPRVEEGDLIVVGGSDARWVIKQVAPTSLKGLTVHQRIMAMELPRTNIEYKVPT